MTNNIGLGEVMRLLVYRDHLHDFDLALTMVGFAPNPRFSEMLADVNVSTPDPSDEDERVYPESVDGWVPSGDKQWKFQADGGADVSDEKTDELSIENIQTYEADWQSVRPPRSQPADSRSEGAGREYRRMSDARQAPRFIIAHVLSPTSTEDRSPAVFAYRSVPHRRRSRVLFEQAHRLDEIAWRLAVECLSATSLKSKRRAIDIAACVDALARCKAIERLPMCQHGARRATDNTLMRDISVSNGPLGGDIAAFVASIQANSRHIVDILGFSQTVEALGCGNGPIWSWRPLDMSTLGQFVIVVSNLPFDAPRLHEAWHRFARSLTDSGRHVTFVNVGESATMMSGDWPGSWFNLVY
jgi:hypothetical protein